MGVTGPGGPGKAGGDDFAVAGGGESAPAGRDEGFAGEAAAPGDLSKGKAKFASTKMTADAIQARIEAGFKDKVERLEAKQARAEARTDRGEVRSDKAEKERDAAFEVAFERAKELDADSKKTLASLAKEERELDEFAFSKSPSEDKADRAEFAAKKQKELARLEADMKAFEKDVKSRGGVMPKALKFILSEISLAIRESREARIGGKLEAAKDEARKKK